MLGLLGAALAGAGQVAALHSVREGVGFSFLLGRFLLLLFSFFVFFSSPFLHCVIILQKFEAIFA